MTERKLCIMVADDDEDDQMLVKQAIADIMDCEVHSVYNGIELLDALSRRGKCAGFTGCNPDFILLDLNMPLLDGFGVLQKIKDDEVLREIPIYILSTSRMDHDKKRSIDLGANGFYTKPILFNQLKEIIEEITAKVSGRAG
jgi:CheY-like chemotaxis protein